MKQSKRDNLLGGLLYCAPFWAMLIPIVIDNFKANAPISDTSILTFAVMMVFWCSGMNLTRIQYLEDEVDKLKEEIEELNKNK